MRRRLLTALLLSSLGIAAQTNEPSASYDSQAQKPDSTTGSPTTVTAEHPASVCFEADAGDPAKDQTKIVHEKTVTPGLLIHKVAPKYPKEARKAHIQGTVLLCAAIGKDGTILNLRAVSGPDLLVQSAIKAVEQWRYKPYLLDGEPVEVHTEIRVNFTLN